MRWPDLPGVNSIQILAEPPRLRTIRLFGQHRLQDRLQEPPILLKGRVVMCRKRGFHGLQKKEGPPLSQKTLFAQSSPYGCVARSIRFAIWLCRLTRSSSWRYIMWPAV